MVSVTEWTYLTPWCAALGPYLSVQEAPIEAPTWRGFVVHVCAFLGHDRSITRLSLLWETLELLALALATSTAGSRHKLLQLCGNVTLMHQLEQHHHDEWEPRFELTFRVDTYGDNASTLTILYDLVSTTWRQEPTEAYQAARRMILSLRDVDANGTPVDRAHISIRLQPPLMIPPAHYMTRDRLPPSRKDTMHYYNNLINVLKVLAQRDARQRPILDGLDLDFTNLETPAEAIPRLGELLGLGVPIQTFALQLGYTWDAFDHDTFLRVFNSSVRGRIDHVVIAATTSDNLEAAFNSLPHMANVHHVELVDHAVFGDIAPSFVAAFRRTMLSTKMWKPKKLTLRGTQFQHLQVKSTTTTALGGLQALAVHVAGQEIDNFVRLLPIFGSQLTSLEIRVTHGSPCTASLAAIAKACPPLHNVQIHNSAIQDLADIPKLMEQEKITWRSLVLQEVALDDTTGLDKIATAFADPTLSVARQLTTFVLTHQIPLTFKTVLAFQNALQRNKRLEVLSLGPVDESVASILAKFNGERLHERQYALISALYHSSRNPDAASTRVDMWNIAHIMNLAGLGRRRRVRTCS